jgi:hypothetical protein
VDDGFVDWSDESKSQGMLVDTINRTKKEKGTPLESQRLCGPANA